MTGVVAISTSNMATAVRDCRARIDLVVDAAMVFADEMPDFIAAMVLIPPWQQRIAAKL
jgi:hypothetical protein